MPIIGYILVSNRLISLGRHMAIALSLSYEPMAGDITILRSHYKFWSQFDMQPFSLNLRFFSCSFHTLKFTRFVSHEFVPWGTSTVSMHLLGGGQTQTILTLIDAQEVIFCSVFNFVGYNTRLPVNPKKTRAKDYLNKTLKLFKEYIFFSIILFCTC